MRFFGLQDFPKITFALSLLIHSSLFLILNLSTCSSQKMRPLGATTEIHIQESSLPQEMFMVINAKDKDTVKKKKKKKKRKEQKILGFKGGQDISPKQRYLYELEAYLQQQAQGYYPSAALKARLKGTVIIQIKIDRKGLFSIFRIVELSGYEIFNEAVRDLIKDLGHFKKIPHSLKEEFMEVEVPIVYEPF